MTASSRERPADERVQVTGDERTQISAVLDAMPMAVMAHTLDFHVVAANALAENVLGCAVEDMIGKRVADFVPEPDRASARVLAVELTSADTSHPIGSLRRVLRADGAVVSCWMHVGLAVIAGHQLLIACMDLVNPVVSDAHRWRVRAERDDLTGLWRRAPFVEHVNAWVADGKQVMLAFVDVDRLKSVNDTYGHGAGDAVLGDTGRRLLEWTPPPGVVGRFSGDEFVVAIPDAPVGLSPAAAAESIRAAICATPVAWQRELLTVSVSVGAVRRWDDEDSGSLIARADAKMYQDKVSRGTAR